MTKPEETQRPSASLASAVRSLLRGLSVHEPQITASAAMTSDGLVIASTLAPGVDSDRFAAMGASLLALSERASQEIERGELRQVLIEGSQGAVLLVRAGSNTVLAVATRPGAQIGKVFLDARATALKLGALFGGGH